MDWGAILTGLKDSVPEMGLGGVILWFLILRENAMRGDREHYMAEIERLQKGRDGESSGAQRQIDTLRQENEVLETRLDRERERRRVAEDQSSYRESPTVIIPPVKELP